MRTHLKTLLLVLVSVTTGVVATLSVQSALDADVKTVHVKPLNKADSFSLAKGKAKAHLLVGAATGAKEGSISILEADKGWGVPEHAHADSAEFLYILEGSGTMFIDGKKFRVKPQSAVYIPKGAKHSFTNGDKPLRAVQFYGGSGPEERFRKIGQPIK